MYCSVQEVGFYTLASKLPSLATMLVPSVFGAVLLPAIAEQFGKGDMEKLRTIYLTSARYLMILAMPIGAFGIALAGPIITLLYGADYTPTIILMQILSLPFAIGSIDNTASAVIFGLNQPAFILKVGGLLAFLNVGLNLWLIPKYGALGAAIASSVPRILILLVDIVFASRRIGAAWPLADTIKIALASIIMGLALFGLQLHLGAAISLALCIPLGIAFYAAAILALRVIREQDLLILKGLQNSLPIGLRKNYTVFLGLTERLIAGMKSVIR
jgi:O-antigen/teichoic acid export membrane protein